jgi:hypothetical protein
LKEDDNLGDLGVDGSIIKHNLKEYEYDSMDEFIWHRIGPIVGSVKNLGFHWR